MIIELGVVLIFEELLYFHLFQTKSLVKRKSLALIVKEFVELIRDDMVESTVPTYLGLVLMN